MRLIDADALMEFARNHVGGVIDCNDIARFPTIEAEPVRHGRWEAYPDDAHMKCSACGMEYLKENMPKVVGYCPNPNCGAKMDGGTDHAAD